MTELDLQNRFEITFDGCSYGFTTSTGVLYQVIFIDYTNVLDISVPVYMLTIARYMPPQCSKKYDCRIQNSILYIIKNFFSENENAIISIYDIEDGKQANRKRLFDGWYNRYNTYLVKEEREIEIDDRKTVTTLLYCSTNKHQSELIAGFNKIIENNFYC